MFMQPDLYFVFYLSAFFAAKLLFQILTLCFLAGDGSDIVIGDPTNVRHVFHVGIDGAKVVGAEGDQV